MLQLYWKNATEQAVGPQHGLTEAEITGIAGPITAAFAAVTDQMRQGKLGYTALPTHKQ